MKTKVLIFFISIIFFACSNDSSSSITFTLFNDLDIDRQDAGFIIKGDLFGQIMHENEGDFFLIQCGEKNIEFQFEDLDNDGENDQIFLLDDFKANEKRQYHVNSIAEDALSNSIGKEHRTNIHFATIHNTGSIITKANRLSPQDSLVSTYYQMEGPAWENDKVGFRNYFDQRNGIDIFGKRTTRMVLQNVGLEGSNYHELDEWGMDILKVGNSLGAGAIALEKNNTLYRVTGSPSSYQLIFKGPLRSRFQLSFDSIQLGDRSIRLVHQISISAGKNYYESKVSTYGLDDDVLLVAGIVNLHSDTLFAPLQANENAYAAIYTHSEQAEDKAHLGMGLLCPVKNYAGNKETLDEGEGITNTYVMKMNIKKDEDNHFCFYTGWQTENESFKNEAYFASMIKQTALRLGTPIRLGTK